MMAAVSFYGVYNFQKDILEKEITEDLESVAVEHLDKLDRTFYERLEDLDVLSANLVIASKIATAAQIKKELDSFQGKHLQFSSVSFLNMDRVRIAASGSSKRVGRQHSLTQYWPAVYEGKNHLVDISRSETRQIPTVHLVVRVTDGKGAALGVLVGRVPVEGLYEMVDGEKNANNDKEKYKVDILNREGLVLYSNHNKQAILNAVDDDFEIIKGELPLVENVGSKTHTDMVRWKSANNGGSELMAFAKEQGYRQFKGNGWILKIEYATKEAFAPITVLGEKVLMLLLLVSVVSAATILLVLSFVVARPLKRLSDATVQLGKGELDTKVAVESADEIGMLAGSFNDMALKLKQMRKELARTAEAALERANMAERRIISISEDTQQQIGQELHDDLGQLLTGVAFMSEVLTQKLKRQSPSDMEDASKITALINEAIHKTRKLAHSLYPVELKEMGLPAMLKKFADDVETMFGIRCEFTCDTNLQIDDPDIAIHLFRITQEAVNNALKHSGATKIMLKLLSSPTMITLEIADDGCGIGNPVGPETKEGLGMHTMQYRASLLGATMHIGETPGGGASITINLPLQQKDVNYAI